MTKHFVKAQKSELLGARSYEERHRHERSKKLKPHVAHGGGYTHDSAESVWPSNAPTTATSVRPNHGAAVGLWRCCFEGRPLVMGRPVSKSDRLRAAKAVPPYGVDVVCSE